KDVTIRHDLHALSAFLQFGLKRHWLRENPLLEVVIPSDVGAVRMHVLTPEEEKIHFQRAARSPVLYDVERIILNQGMRPEEVLELQKADIELERGLIHVTKGKTRAARRTLTMTSQTREILERRLFLPTDSRWVFPSRRVPGAHVGRINGAHD